MQKENNSMKIECCEFPFFGIYMERDRVVIQYSYHQELPTFKRLATLSVTGYRHCEERSNLYCYEAEYIFLETGQIASPNNRGSQWRSV